MHVPARRKHHHEKEHYSIRLTSSHLLLKEVLQTIKD